MSMTQQKKRKVKKDTTDIKPLKDLNEVSFIGSGIEEIDDLTGGVPVGRITEIYGGEGIGKSTLVSRCAAEISKTGRVLYVDAEQSLNKARVVSLGADLSKVDYTALYELAAVADLVVESLPKYQCVIIDSIAVLTPKAILEGDIGSSNIGLFSREMARFVKKLKPAVNQSNCALICINQFRQSPDMFAPRYVPGGTAYMHCLDLRLELSTKSADKIIEEGVRVGHWVNVKVTKSRVSQPFATTKFKLLYGGKGND